MQRTGVQEGVMGKHNSSRKRAVASRRDNGFYPPYLGVVVLETAACLSHVVSGRVRIYSCIHVHLSSSVVNWSPELTCS